MSRLRDSPWQCECEEEEQKIHFRRENIRALVTGRAVNHLLYEMTHAH